MSASWMARLTRTGANLVSAIGEVFHILPDSNVGALSTFVTLPTGKKLAFMFDTIARIMQTVAEKSGSRTNRSYPLCIRGRPACRDTLYQWEASP